MTDFDSREDFERRHADDGGNLGDREFIQEQIRADFERMAIVYDDVGDLPASSEARLKPGSFDDPASLLDWLEDGGLVSYDVDGNPVPIGFVYLVARYDEDFDTFEYDVYVDKDTDSAT